jgi:anion-transporting  ArsA/GET3 family ATPase
LFSLTSKPFFAVADRILGAGFLGDISEFFTLFRTMEIGFVERAKRVETMLTNSETAFAVVTTLESAPLHEAQFLINELRARKFVLSSVIVNRVIAKTLVSEVDEALPQLVQATQNDQFAQRIASATATPVEQIIGVIASIVDKSREILVDAHAERSDLAAFAAECAHAGTQTIESALQGGSIGDLRGLLAIGQHLLPA